MLLGHGYAEENILGVYGFFIFSFSTVTTEASSSDRVEQWGRPRGISAAALAAVVNQRPFQPHFWHTLHLVSSFSLFFPPSACLGSFQTDDAWQTAGNKSTHFTPKSRGRPNAASTVRTNATQPQREPGWKGGLEAGLGRRRGGAAVLWTLGFVLLLWPDQRGWLSALAALIRRHTSLFRGSDKMEQLLHTFVFSQRRALPSNPVWFLFCSQSVPVRRIVVTKSIQKLSQFF